jgi:hypothetical protein
MATTVKERSSKRLESALALLGFTPVTNGIRECKFWIADPVMYSDNPDATVKMVLTTQMVKPTLDVYEFSLQTTMNGQLLPPERQVKTLIMTLHDWVEQIFPRQMILIEMHDFFELKSPHTGRWDES